jgi:hypothetical protein
MEVSKTVDQILRKKGYDVWSVLPDDTVYRALEVMAEKKNRGRAGVG